MKDRLKVISLLSALLIQGTVCRAGQQETPLADKVKAKGSWHCYYSHKVNVNHLSDGSVASGAPPVTLAWVRCDRLNEETGKPTGYYETTYTSCKASGRTSVPDVDTCVDLSVSPTRGASWASGQLSKTTDLESNKFGRSCQYLTEKPLILYRDVPKGGNLANGKMDAVCATPVACDNFDQGPRDFVVTCPLDGTKTVEVEGKQFHECPRVNRCYELSTFSLAQAFTDEEIQRRNSVTVSSRLQPPPPLPAPAPPMQAHAEK